MLKSIILIGCRVNVYNEMRALEKESYDVCFRMVRGGRGG